MASLSLRQGSRLFRYANQLSVTKKFLNYPSITVITQAKANNPFSVYVQGRCINTTSPMKQENENDQSTPEEDDANDADNWMTNYTGDLRDRTRVIPVETSLSYMESEAYRSTYGNHKVIYQSSLLLYTFKCGFIKLILKIILDRKSVV